MVIYSSLYRQYIDDLNDPHDRPIFVTNQAAYPGLGVSVAHWYNGGQGVELDDDLTVYAGCDGDAGVRTRPLLNSARPIVSYAYKTNRFFNGIQGFAVFNANLGRMESHTDFVIRHYVTGGSINPSAHTRLELATVVAGGTRFPKGHPFSYVVRCGTQSAGAIEGVYTSIHANGSDWTGSVGRYPEIGDVWPVRFWGAMAKPERGYPIEGVFESVTETVPTNGGGERKVVQGFCQARFKYTMRVRDAVLYSNGWNEYEYLREFHKQTGFGAHPIGVIPPSGGKAPGGPTWDQGYGVIGSIVSPVYMCNIDSVEFREVNRKLHEFSIELSEVAPYYEGYRQRFS
jgi:hypothetical protein